MGSCETMERAIDETHERIDYLFYKASQNPDVLMGVLNAIYSDQQLELVRV